MSQVAEDRVTSVVDEELPDERYVVRIPAHALSHEGFRAWVTSDDGPERGRYAYINGEIYVDMSPEELDTHIKVKGEVLFALHGLVKQHDLGEFFADGALVSNQEAGVSNEPDGTFVSWASYAAGRVALTPREGHPGQYTEIVGTPDLVVEVISRSSISKDTRLLREAYHRAGIPEYWLIDARFADEVRFTILRHEPGGYVAVEPERGWLRSAVLGRKARLERRRNRAGRWAYTMRLEEG